MPAPGSEHVSFRGPTRQVFGVNPDLIEDLLHEEEGTSLDFKRDQYRFGGTKSDKSELLKDILAFANAFRRDDAYILIGVEEVRGGRSKVVGVQKHLDDANLQQFVNSKTQRPVTFSYQQAVHDGVEIGIVHIPVQARPLYAKADFGVVRKNIVYIRRSSSTDAASPDEVARMRDADIALTHQPSLELDIIERGTRRSLGTRLTVDEPTWLEVPPAEDIPDYQPIRDTFSMFGLHGDNAGFFREVASYMAAIRLFRVTLALRNTAGTAAHDVRVVFEIPDEEQRYRFMAASDMPDEPRRRVGPDSFRHTKSVFSNQLGVEVHREGREWRVECRFGKIQPGAAVRLEEDVLVGARDPGQLDVDGVVYADNLRAPSSVSFCLDFQQGADVLTLDRMKHVARSVRQ